MADSIPLPNLKGMRARITRLSDAKMMTGWIQAVSGSVVTATADMKFPVAVGEAMLLEVHAAGSNVMLKGNLTESNNGSLHFIIVGPPLQVQSNEAIRVAVEGMTCTVRNDGVPVQGCVLDIGPQGIGIELPVELTKGDLIEVTVPSMSGDIVCKAEVRYCRKPSPDSPIFRVGLLLKLDDRVSKAKWAQAFALAIAA